MSPLGTILRLSLKDCSNATLPGKSLPYQYITRTDLVFCGACARTVPPNPNMHAQTKTSNPRKSIAGRVLEDVSCISFIIQRAASKNQLERELDLPRGT